MVIILMGVMGSGKTAFGRKLAETLDIPFFDADDLHSELNRQKIGRGEALTDEDRAPWLELLAAKIKGWNKSGDLSVLACSALKQKYRDLLSRDENVRWVFLKGPIELIRERLKERQGHFADPRALESQFADLEEPQDAILVDISKDPDKIVAHLVKQLKGN